jgi:riboflavin kinase/FMN adenylyltransferase
VGNIGLRPTLDGPKAPSVEVHLLDFSEDLYGQELAFEIRHYLRSEKAFDSLESLRRQISEDVSSWRKTGAMI